MTLTRFKFRQEHNESIYFRFLLPVIFIASMFILTPITHANELTPKDNIRPSQIEPSLGNAPEKELIRKEEANIPTVDSSKKQYKPSWWKWLTSSSKKPANFHYIDIIELIS